jgi:predicted ArsR family transcriptional regulator
MKNVRTQESVAVAADPVVPAGSTSEARTRDRVARTLLENGPMTAAALAEGLELTAAAVRRHLDAFVTDGLVEERVPRSSVPRGRGRPARLFGLTDTGRDTFDQAYDDLAASALRFLADQGGREAVVAFARERVAELEARYRPIVEAVPAQQRTEALARALTADGYAASARSTGTIRAAGSVGGTGEQLCQHHCPVAHVAEQFPELCEAETEVFAKLLGTHVQRLATIAHGDGVCTTYIPGAAHDAAAPAVTAPPTPPATRSSR